MHKDAFTTDDRTQQVVYCASRSPSLDTTISLSDWRHCQERGLHGHSACCAHYDYSPGTAALSRPRLP